MSNTDNLINVDNHNVIEMVKAAYDLSRSAFEILNGSLNKPMTDSKAKAILDAEKNNKRLLVRLDYLNCRRCKFRIYKIDGSLWITKNWLDHTEADLKELLKRSEIKTRGI